MDALFRPQQQTAPSWSSAWSPVELLRQRGDVPPTGSELETRFVQLVRTTAVPTPERQVPVTRRGRVIARLDLAWPEVGLFVELDGVASHDRVEALLYDRHRQNEIVTSLGWRPLRFTWSDVVHRPRTTAREVERAHRYTFHNS